MARRAHRLRRRWDLACDHAVNQLLHDDGLTVPPGAPIDARFRGLAAEEIYPLLPEDPDTESIDRHVLERDGAGGGLAGFLGESNLGAGDQGGVVSASTGDTGAQPDEAAEDSWDDAGYEKRRKAPAGSRDTVAVPRASPMELEQLWRSRLATAAQAARDAGRLGQSWARVLEKLIAPTLPWRALLARYVVTAAREDYTFQRPPRRDGMAILPRLARGSMRIVAVLDTSGSITANELNEFAQELDALKAQVRAELTIHACDERLAPDGPWVFDPWEPVQLPESVSGGGGTRFTPVFEWVERSAIVPDLLVYFTDAQGEFPDAEPPYPVLWLVKGRAPVPFGERVQLN
jgi:predicted metal-dependent peptidase